VTSRQQRAGRIGAAAIAALASRLTERDRQVALACYEHRVLTSEQLRRLYFRSSRRAQLRLAELCELRVLDRFRPVRQPGEGSAPYHWILDEAGAHVVAACLDLDRSELRWRRQAAIAISRSSKLQHQLEVNEFFTQLAEHAHQTGGRLISWWGERRCLAALGGQPAPDGYGRLQLPGQGPVSFLLELDRGSEDYERLRHKARRYQKALPRSPLADEQPLILLAVPTPARRDSALRAVAASTAPIQVVVWTPRHSAHAALEEALLAASRRARSRGTNHSTLTIPIDLAPPPAPYA
jgi:hypothetical protein